MAVVNKALTTTYRIIYSDIEYLLSELIEINEPNKYNIISKIIDNNEI
jgi:hypothetical protein